MSARAEVQAARQRLGRDRRGALTALDEAFAAGTLPDPPLHGRYRGALIAPSLHPLLDALGSALAGLWLPWQGKTFDRATSTGDNVFSNSGLPLARLIWPAYRGYVPDGPGRSRACEFRTYAGPGALDPARQVLKIDYDWDRNPRFLIRAVLDELVQVEAGYYLGQALLRRRGGRYVCAAYFTLSA